MKFKFFKMENFLASPIRKFSEKAGKCLLEYEALYNNSRLSMSEEDYSEFTRLLMDDSASDADDEITDTSHEELNSSAEIYRPRNVYSIADGNKPLTLVIKKQQRSCNDLPDNLDKISEAQEENTTANENNEKIIRDRTYDLPLHDSAAQKLFGNCEFVSSSSENVPMNYANLLDEETKKNNMFDEVDKCVESNSGEKRTFPLKDFDRFYDEANRILQKFYDPVVSGYEANCESEEEVQSSCRKLKYNGNSVEGWKDKLKNEQYAKCNSGFNGEISDGKIAQTKPTIYRSDKEVLNKGEDCADQYQNINEINISNSVYVQKSDFLNEDILTSNEHKFDAGHRSPTKTESNISFSTTDCLDNVVSIDPGIIENTSVSHWNVDELVISGTKCTANMYVPVNENQCVTIFENDACSSTKKVREHTVYHKKDNTIMEHYESAEINNELINVENELEILSESVHNPHMESSSKMVEHSRQTDKAFHESLFEETTDCGADSLAENGFKVGQASSNCESEGSLKHPAFMLNEEQTEIIQGRITMLEYQESKINVKHTNFLGHNEASLKKSPDNEAIKQNEVVDPECTTLEEENSKTLEIPTDKSQSEVGTPSHLGLSDRSLLNIHKEDVTCTVELLEESNERSTLNVCKEHSGAFPADSFVDDAMDCSYNDSSSYLDHSPLLFSSDDENYYYTEDSAAADLSKSCELQSQTQQERRKLCRLQRALAGVPPPPYITIPQMDVNEILKLIKENKKLMKFESVALNNEGKEGSPVKKDDKRPLTPLCIEQVKNLSWPESKSCNFYGVQYNKGKVSEEFEMLYEKLRDRYVGCETMSSCNVWFPGISARTLEKKLKRRSIGHSPGRRLSHLAKRRQAFSSANLLPSVAGSLPTAAARQGRNRLIMVEIKKGDHRAKSKAHPIKKAATLNVSSKLQQTKRALFKSPSSGHKKPTTKSRSSSKKAKREVDRSRIHNSKRALWPSSEKSENTVPDTSNLQHMKRKREESGDEDSHKFPRRSLFNQRNREKNCKDSLAKSQTLSQQHKKKLLWAVAETLRTKGVTMNHPSFRTLASSLARKVCSNLPDMSQRREGRTSELMLQIAKEHVNSIIRTLALKDKTEPIKV